MRSDVTIADDDKLQFYLEEIYDSNHFDKQEMLTWERQPTATKTDFDLAKAHFEEIVNATDTYEQRTCLYIKSIYMKSLPCKIDFMQKIWCERHIFDFSCKFDFI